MLVAFSMSSPANPDSSPLVPEKTAERTDSIGTADVKQDLSVVAENEQDPAESKSSTASDKDNQTSGSESKTKQQSGKNSDDAATKPLKPFVPSEKIAADQAVDFPVDI